MRWSKTIYIFSVMFFLITSFCVSAQRIGHYEVKLEDFTQLKVVDGINVNYVSSVDSAGIAVFDAPDNVASLIAFQPNKSKLTIQYDERKAKYTGMPTVTVYSKFLTSVENQSDSTIRILKSNSGPELKLKVMGNGRIIAKDLVVNNLSANITTGRGMIVVTGQCTSASLTNLGTGQIQADNLRAEKVKAKLTGTGVIGCYPVQSLDVIGIGTGKVYYRGEPANIEKNTIKAQVIKLDEDDEEQNP